MTRILSWLLRHGAKKEGLSVNPDGSVPVDEVLAHRRVASQIRNLDQLRQVVASDNKGRFELLDKNGKLCIRAVQGHSIEIDADQAMVPISAQEAETLVAVHGTYRKFLDSILTDGLCRMTRMHIHFAQGLPESGVISGMRSSAQVAIYADLPKAIADGIPFFKSANGVILTPGIGERGLLPPIYFSQVVDLKTRNIVQHIPLKPRNDGDASVKDDATGLQQPQVASSPSSSSSSTSYAAVTRGQNKRQKGGSRGAKPLNVVDPPLPCAGVVVFDKMDAPTQVVLVKTHNDVWGFPKGKRNSGESMLDCAKRELLEETGIHSELLVPIDPERYVDEPSSRTPKAQPGETTPQQPRPAIRLFVTSFRDAATSYRPKPEDVEELADARMVPLEEAFLLLAPLAKRVDVLQKAIALARGA